MKICLLTNLYPPDRRGGAEAIVATIANYLKNNHQVIIITTASKKKIVQAGNLKIYYLFNWNLYHLLNDYKFPWLIRLLWHKIDLFNFIIWHKVKKILISEKPDLIWTHNLKGLSLGLPRVINKLEFKHLHQLHDLQLIDPAGTLYRTKKGNIGKLNLGLKIYCYFTKKFTKNIPRVISPSNFTLARHKNLGFFPHAKTLVLPNPISNTAGYPRVVISSEVEKSLFKKVSNTRDFSIPLRSSQNDKGNTIDSLPFNLFYLGQIEEQKGIIFLIKAFKKMNNPAWQLFIAGRGQQENNIKELIKNNPKINFLGFLVKEQLNELFKKIDLVVLPSLCYENSPTVIYESYQQGTAVLVSDSGGQVELVEKNKTGLIFKTGDENDLIEKISYAFNNRQLLNSWSKACLEKAKGYGIEKYLEKVFEFITHT